MSKQKREVRNNGEIRAVADEEGYFEGYLTVWGTVDSYNSTFKRGAFKKTIQERSSKIKVLYNHDELIGRAIELREDDYGLFAKGKLTLDVRLAAETYAFMKDEVLTALSFGFATIKDGMIDGVRQITEAKLFEFSPVIFPSNENAVVTDVRKDDESMNTEEQRAEDFEKTLEQSKLRKGGWERTYALENTLDDIWWNSDTESVIGKLDEAISKFNASYLEWAAAYVAEFWANEERSAPNGNELSDGVNAYLSAEKLTVNDLATRSALTLDEVSELRRGHLINAREKLTVLPDEIQVKHKELRCQQIEKLFNELRGGLTAIEKRRISALLEPVAEQSEPSIEDTLDSINQFNKSLENKDD